MLGATQYEYEPLKPASNGASQTIRVLTIWPAHFGDDLVLHLEAQSLDGADSKGYEALSYVWGSNSDPVTVFIGQAKAPVPVTQNLAHALRHLRYSDRPRTIWTDALCINQKDSYELSSQVEFMGDIYKRANRVVVWLGLEYDESMLALQVLDVLGSKVHVNWDTNTINPSSDDPAEQHWADKLEILPYNKRQLDALASLFHRSWFERLWIRQEIILSQNAIVQCGNHCISWERLRGAIFVIASKDRSRIIPQTEIWTWVNSNQSRLRLLYQVCTTKSVELNDLNYSFSQSICQDPRDRIYAVLSLLSDKDKALGIKPQYHLDTQTVYRDVATRYVQYSKDLNILTQCRHTAPFADPTWVPDWSIPAKSIPPLAWTTAASGDLSSQATVDEKILRVHGTQVDKVQKVFNFDAAKIIGTVHVYEALQQLVPSDAAEAPYPAGGTVLEAFSRTFMRDYLKEFLSFPGIPLDLKPLAEVTASLKHLLSTTLSEYLEREVDPIMPTFASFAADSMVNYSLFVTENGYLGLGRKDCVEIGDNICCFLGCDFPMILRPYSDMKYHLIGESFVCGLMYAEAFLGPLPPHFSVSRKIFETADGLKAVRAYLNHENEALQHEDPRLVDSFSVDFSVARLDWEKHSDTRIFVSLDKLQNAGVEMCCFDII